MILTLGSTVGPIEIGELHRPLRICEIFSLERWRSSRLSGKPQLV